MIEMMERVTRYSQIVYNSSLNIVIKRLNLTTMMTTTISIHVDNALAESFLHASDDKKRQLELLLNLRLQELVSRSQRSVLNIADEIGEYAISQGMTAEILETLLNEK